MNNPESTKKCRAKMINCPCAKEQASVKGQAFDEMQRKSDKLKSPKTKQIKVMEKEKSRVSRRIVFDEKPDKQVNNNSNLRVKTRSTRSNQLKIQNKSSGLSNARHEKEAENLNQRASKIVDPCFKNVLRKELQQERLLNKIKLKGKGVVQKANKPLNILQVEGEKTHKRDGIQLEVDGLEELDYVDDVIDDELSDFEVEEVQEETDCPPSNMDFVDKSLPRGMIVTSHMTTTKSSRQTEQQAHSSMNVPQSSPKPRQSCNGGSIVRQRIS